MVQYINIHWKRDRAKSGMLMAKNLSSDPVLILPSHRHEAGYIFYEGQEFRARERPKPITIFQQIVNF